MSTAEETAADIDPPTTRIDPGRAPDPDLDPPTARIDAAGRTPDALPDTAPLVDEPSDSVAFDEFRLYYESAERVAERRLDLHRHNHLALVALLLLIGVVFGWATGRPDHELVGTVGVVVLCLVGYLHCAWWARQLDDLRELSSEKVRILNDMAPYVCFPDTDRGRELRSYEPFRREWSMMMNRRAVREYPGLGRVLVPRSATAEYRMARVFAVVFWVIAAGTLALLLTDGNLAGHLSPFGHG